ncbi:MAG: choice-of-anchor B family protein [Gemmatimonadota bacterium]
MKLSGCQLLALLVIAGAATPVKAQSFRSDPGHEVSTFTGFGRAVAVGDGEIFVGEPENHFRSGIVYLYRRDAPTGAWKEAARLVAPEAATGDGFGRSLAVDGNTLLVGSGAEGHAAGVVHVFRRVAVGKWVPEVRIVPDEGKGRGSFGTALALIGDVALIGSFAEDDSTGAAYVYRHDPTSGDWSRQARVVPADLEPGDRFGAAVSLHGDVAIIGASRQDSAAGSAYVFRHDAATGGWTEEAKLRGTGIEKEGGFGSSLMLAEDVAFIGAPGHDGYRGAVFEFRYDRDTGEWTERSRLVPFDGERQSRFGSTLAFAGADVFVGAPGASRFAGTVYRIRRDAATGGWAAAAKLAHDGLERGDFFAGSLAARGGVGVAGVLGDDYGAGAAVIFERSGSGGVWKESATVLSEAESLDPIIGGEVECTGGSASLFDCSELDLLSFLPVSAIGGGRGARVNDVWGWTDPQTGREYALVGRVDGTSFIDISDPYNPVYLGDLPKTEGSPGSVWRDIKVYENHAFIVSDGAGEHGMQVFDLTRLRSVSNPPVTFEETAHYDGIHSAHNIVINEETGFAFAVGTSSGGETCGGGLHMIDIRDPEKPTFAGCFADSSTGRRKTGYTHDAQCVVYHGPDAEHRGREICFGANETALSISDVTEKEHPVAVSRAEYPNVGYAHQGWLTEDHRYFFMDDELDELSGDLSRTRTLIWDVTDLDDPVLLKEYFGETKATDHNLYIRGHYMYQSNYRAGLRVVDIRDVEHPVEIAFFDTVPYGENTPGMGGSWSNYPFFESGTLVVTSGSEGVFIVKKRPELVP